VTLISSYVELKAAGSELKGCCPLHEESNPSFTVSPSRQVFHCFGCHAGGDCFAFVMRNLRVDFVDAVGILAEQAGIDLDQACPLSISSDACSHQAPAQARPQEPLVPIPDTIRLQEFVGEAQQSLWNLPDLQARWLTNRNITLAAVKAWGVGFLEGPISWPVIGRSLEARNVWVLPISDSGGSIRAAKLHIEDEEFRKQHGSKSRWACFGLPHPDNNGQRRHAYQTLWPPPEWWFEEQDERAAIMEFQGGVSRAEAERESGWQKTCLYLLPGELKALRWISAGEAATSITRGESMRAEDWTPKQIARLRAHRLVIVHDNDEAGRIFRDETVKALSGHIEDLRTFTHG
jgi:hypothetical protein